MFTSGIFVHTGTGKITEDFKQALRTCGFKASWASDASVQPGHLEDALLHETAVSWLRKRLETSLPSRCWGETPAAFGARLRRRCSGVNAERDVAGLCRSFSARIQELMERNGDRLKK